jgi:hypothetical protein
MNLSSINNYFNNHTASVLSTGLQSSSAPGSASGQLSPFAQLLTTLQQLDQSNPTQYKQVTKQIATNLQSAAATATKNGNGTEATQLATLAKDFSSASQSGQLPNVQDLASALGGVRQHLPAHAAASDASLSTNAALQQLLASFQTSSNQNSSTNPLSIVMSTLSNAGIKA